MAKMLLTISTISILAFIVVAMYCAMIVAGRSDENENKGNSNEGDDDMFGKNRYAQDAKLENTLMNLILNQRLVRTSGVGNVISVTFISL